MAATALRRQEYTVLRTGDTARHGAAAVATVLLGVEAIARRGAAVLMAVVAVATPDRRGIPAEGTEMKVGLPVSARSAATRHFGAFERK